ncbi:MAG: hypothetical protein AAF992_15180 [Bacteroidota bacterium]
MNLTVPIKRQVLIFSLIFSQSAVAQPPAEATNLLDSLIQQFIDQYSITLTPDELTGSYSLREGFWQESIQLKDNGRFKVTDTGGFSYVSVNRGSWQVNESEVLLSGKQKQEIAYLLKYNGNVCLLTSGTIQRWKELTTKLQTNESKLAYDPFFGKISLYKKEPVEDDLK